MFGRRIEFDAKSRNFPIRELITPRQALAPRSYTWRNPIRLDQVGGSCVGNAWAHEAAAKPVMVPGINEAIALKLYHRAQELDEYTDTPPAEGSSVLAGAKAAQEAGYLKTYRWAFGLEDLVLAVGYHGHRSGDELRDPSASIRTAHTDGRPTPKPDGVSLSTGTI